MLGDPSLQPRGDIFPAHSPFLSAAGVAPRRTEMGASSEADDTGRARVLGRPALHPCRPAIGGRPEYVLAVAGRYTATALRSSLPSGASATLARAVTRPPGARQSSGRRNAGGDCPGGAEAWALPAVAGDWPSRFVWCEPGLALRGCGWGGPGGSTSMPWCPSARKTERGYRTRCPCPTSSSTSWWSYFLNFSESSGGGERH